MPIYYPQPEPTQAVRRVLPVTPGSQPPKIGPFGGSAAVLSAVAIANAVLTVPMPTQKPLNIVPLTLKYGSQPIPSGPIGIPELSNIRSQWPNDGEPRLPVRVETPLTAPLTLKYGSQPVPPGPIGIPELSNILSQWPKDGEPRLPVVLEEPFCAAWSFIPPITNTPPSRAPGYILVLPDGWNAQGVRPSALNWSATVVNNPPLRAPGFLLVLADWWSTQSEEPTASWNVLSVVQGFVPKLAQPPQIFDAWLNDPTVIVWVGDGAGIFPVGGDTVLAMPRQLVQVAPGWDTQHAALGAAWNTVPPVVNNPPPRKNAFPTTWDVLWSAQSEEFNASWNVPPAAPSPFIPFTRPSYHTEAPWWNAQSEEFNASWNVPAVVSAFVPRFSPPIRVDAALWGTQRAAVISPLALLYGSQPLPVGPISRQKLQSIIRQWPEQWWPAQAAGHATLLSKQLIQFVYRAVFSVPLIRVELHAVQVQSDLLYVVPASSLVVPVPASILRLP